MLDSTVVSGAFSINFVCRLRPYLVFNFPSYFFQRLLLGLSQRQPGRYRVALGQQGALLLLRERQRAGRTFRLAADQRRLYGLPAAAGAGRRGWQGRRGRQEQPLSGRQRRSVVRRYVTALAIAGCGRRRCGRQCETCERTDHVV